MSVFLYENNLLSKTQSGCSQENINIPCGHKNHQCFQCECGTLLNFVVIES
jgi:hypothetical protein